MLAAAAATRESQQRRGAGEVDRAAAAAAAAGMTELLLFTCQRWRITLQDIEALALPSWGFDVSFPDRGAWVDYLSEQDTRLSRQQFLGEIQGLKISLPDVRFHIQSARWVELLDGTVLARLMTDGRPTCVMPWAHPCSINAVLAGIREVPWDPDRFWMFPRWHKDRLVFLAWVGSMLRLNPIWIINMFPFLPMEPQLTAKGFQVGQAVYYRSTTHRRWLQCRVTRVDPISGSIMLDVKPGCWISFEEQAEVCKLARLST